MMSTAERFLTLFATDDVHHGTYEVPKDAVPDAAGKLNGRALTVHAPATLALVEAHLAGKRSLGLRPIRRDSTCSWAAIDIDSYQQEKGSPEEIALIAEVIQKCERLRVINGMEPVYCRSKSGGLHILYFVAEPIPAALMRKVLYQVVLALGLKSTTERFPKQDGIGPDDKGFGWINLPYFNGVEGGRYCTDPSGTKATVGQFLNFAAKRTMSADWFTADHHWPTPPRQAEQQQWNDNPAEQQGSDNPADGYLFLKRQVGRFTGRNFGASDGLIDAHAEDILEAIMKNRPVDEKKQREYREEARDLGRSLRKKEGGTPAVTVVAAGNPLIEQMAQDVDIDEWARNEIVHFIWANPDASDRLIEARIQDIMKWRRS